MGLASPLRLHTLPLDILIDVLKSLSSFTYLLPLLLTHRAFNEVWKENFKDVSQAIAHHEFEPWEDAIKLMLQQLHPDDDVIITSKASMHLSKEDLAQMHSNRLYLGIMEKHHDRKKEKWGGSPMSESETELLRFRRAAYRAWRFALTLELPACEELTCDMFSLVELIEMQSAAKDFVWRTNWPGLPDFFVQPPGTTVQSLEGVMRRRISDYCRCDPGIDLTEVYNLKSLYASLKLQDQSLREDFIKAEEKLMSYEKAWREKKAEEKKVE